MLLHISLNMSIHSYWHKQILHNDAIEPDVIYVCHRDNATCNTLQNYYTHTYMLPCSAD